MVDPHWDEQTAYSSLTTQNRPMECSLLDLVWSSEPQLFNYLQVEGMNPASTSTYAALWSCLVHKTFHRWWRLPRRYISFVSWILEPNLRTFRYCLTWMIVSRMRDCRNQPALKEVGFVVEKWNKDLGIHAVLSAISSLHDFQKMRFFGKLSVFCIVYAHSGRCALHWDLRLGKEQFEEQIIKVNGRVCGWYWEEQEGGLNGKGIEWGESKEPNHRSQSAGRREACRLQKAEYAYGYGRLSSGFKLMKSFVSLWPDVKLLLTVSQTRSAEVGGHTQCRSSIQWLTSLRKSQNVSAEWQKSLPQ